MTTYDTRTEVARILNDRFAVDYAQALDIAHDAIAVDYLLAAWTEAVTSRIKAALVPVIDAAHDEAVTLGLRAYGDVFHHALRAVQQIRLDQGRVGV